MLPKKLWIGAVLTILIPFILYCFMPEAYKWLATLVGLLAFGLIFTSILLLYVLNKKNEMVVKWSPLRNSNKKKYVDLSIRFILGYLSVWGFINTGIPVLMDTIYLLGGGTPTVVEATVINSNTTFTGWLTGTQRLTLQQLDGGNDYNRVRSSFIYEKYTIGVGYKFEILPYSKVPIKVQPLNR